jgi:hemerythrin-like domain-containing protein
MLRDKSLIPLSRQHQHALALCVRIDRASPIPGDDLPSWQQELTREFEAEIKFHFAAEERVLFPAARRFKELAALADELQAEHVLLRKSFSEAEARRMTPSELSAFAERLARHIRIEERQLFERMQELLKPEELATLGVQLEDALKDAAQACSLPNETTRLRTKN